MKSKSKFSFSRRSKQGANTSGETRKDLLKEVQALQGKIGHTLTKLKLVGFVEVNGEKFEAKSESGIIQSGVPVRIIGSAFGILRVEPLKNLLGL